MLAFLTSAHHLLYNMLSLYAVLAGLYAAYHFITRQAPSGNLWGVLAIAEGLAAAQVLIGLLTWLAGAPPPARLELHILYGLSTIATLPLVYGLMRNRNPVLMSALFSVACFFIWGLAQRAAETAALQ